MKKRMKTDTPPPNRPPSN